MPLQLNLADPPTADAPFKLSASSVRLFQLCPRKFGYRYRYGIEGKAAPDDRQAFGTAVHHIIEHNANNPPADWRVGAAVVGLDVDLGCLVAGTAAAYASYWAGQLSYAATELELVTPLRNPRMAYLAIIDGLATDQAGRTVLVEHKTTESDIRPGGWYFEKLQLDLQASTYLWAARAHGIAAEHVEWDVIKRPRLNRRAEAIEPEYYVKSGKWGAVGDLKPGTGVPAETPAEFAARVKQTMLAAPVAYFQRAPVYRMQDEIDAAMADVESVGQQICAAWDADQWTRNPASCMSYGRRCEMWELCTGAAQPTDEALYQLRTPRERAAVAP
jgi:hypothetical protein